MVSEEGEFQVVARLEDVPDGGLLGVALAGGERLCLIRDGESVWAVRDECTHQAFPLSAGELVADGVVECVWHGARFDYRTGAVRRGPAEEPLPLYPVRVENGQVLVGRRTR